MELHPDDIAAFKSLFEQEFEEFVDWAEAERMASEVLALYETIWTAKLNEAALPPEDASARSAQSAT